MKYRLSEYDYVDVGCGDGGSLHFGRDKFLGEKGIGIDLDQRKIEEARRNGHDVILADASDFDPSPHRFNFLICNHLLEHLPDVDAASCVIARFPRLAKHFAYIATPSFEGERYLKGLSLRQFWANWTGHRTHITVADYIRILRERGFAEFEIRCVGLIPLSSDPCIIPYDLPLDQFRRCPKHS